MQTTDEKRRAESDARDAVHAWLRARREAIAHPGDMTLGDRRLSAEIAAWKAVHTLVDGPTACATSASIVTLDEAVIVGALPKGIEVDSGFPTGAESMVLIRVADIVRVG